LAINLFGLSIPQISLPSLPKIEVPKFEIPEPPKIEIPKITVPDIPKVTVPDIPKIVTSPVPVAAVAGAGGEAVGGAVAGAVPKVEVPKISLPSLPKVELPKVDPPKISLPEVSLPSLPKVEMPKIDISRAITTAAPAISLPLAVAGAAAGAVQRGETPKVDLPKPLTDAWGAISQGIDAVIGARDKSYEVGLEQAFAGNVAGGGTQVAATAAFDMLLPLDAVDVINKLATGRGDELTSEDYLFAAIDTLGVAGSVFTLGGSYAASRALKAALKGGKVAIKGNVIGRVIRSTRGVGSSALNKGKDVLSRIKTPTPTKAPDPGDVSRLLRETREAQMKMTRQIDEMRESLTKTVSGLKPLDETVKLPNRLSKTGTYLTGAALGAGGTAIGLTALGALGAPAPQEIPEGGDGGGGALGGGDQVTGAGDDWWSEFIKSLYGGGAYDPSLYEGYDPYAGYYDPGYPDLLGLEPYAQDLLTYAEEVPVVGGVATAAKQSGFALPLIVGAIILVVLAVAFFRSKKGKQVIGGVKKQVSGAINAGKKAVGA